MIDIGGMEIIMDVIKIKVIEIKIKVIETKIKVREIKVHKVIGTKVMINDNTPIMILMGTMIIINGLVTGVPLITEIVIAMMMSHLHGAIIGIIGEIMMTIPLHVEIIIAEIGEKMWK